MNYEDRLKKLQAQQSYFALTPDNIIHPCVFTEVRKPRHDAAFLAVVKIGKELVFLSPLRVFDTQEEAEKAQREAFESGSVDRLKVLKDQVNK